MIYTRFGVAVELLRPITSIEELPLTEDRDAHAEERIELGQWWFAKLTVLARDSRSGKDEPLDGERVVDLALCRADGGSREIHDTANRLNNPS